MVRERLPLTVKQSGWSVLLPHHTHAQHCPAHSAPPPLWQKLTSITTFAKITSRELQKASLGTLGRTGCKHCSAGWPVRSCGLCLEEMDEKVQASSWMKTELSRIHLWIWRIKGKKVDQDCSNTLCNTLWRSLEHCRKSGRFANHYCNQHTQEQSFFTRGIFARGLRKHHYLTLWSKQKDKNIDLQL